MWRVESETEIAPGRHLLKMRDVSSGNLLEALCPPDRFESIGVELPDLDVRASVPYGLWRDAHHALDNGQVADHRPASIYAGRITPEAYQQVPIMRMLRLPKPSLLIADDVGLGKTIEVGLCLQELIARGRANRILLVVPPGLITQWRDEEMREKFGLHFYTIENAAGFERAKTDLAEGMNPWSFRDRVITSVDYLKRREVQAHAFERVWDVIVADEAHCLAESGTPRNPYSTQRTRLGRVLRDKSRALILLTATPHNGHRHSFRSLLELVAPTDAVFEGDHATVTRRLQRSMIRRLKPQIYRTESGKSRVPAFVPREPVRAIEVRHAVEADRTVFRLLSQYCARAAKAARNTDAEDLVSFAMQIIKKRMLSSRAALAATIDARLDALAGRGETTEPPSRSEIRELQSDLPLGETEHERIAQRVIRSAVPKETRRRNEEKRQLRAIREQLDEALKHPDAKFSELIKDIRARVLADPEGKAIVFTEYRDTLDALKARFENEPDLKGLWVELRGGLSARLRLAALERFKQPDCRILLATDAASEGLNLQHHCHRLYHLELPWNPNRLEQRNGRIDRHGQTKPPQIAYLFYPDSPEDRVLDRLVRRIVQMQDDRVSTPDILGILSDARIDAALTELDADADQAENDERERSLFRVFDENRADFVREVAPLLTRPGAGYDGDAFDPYSADPIVGDDDEFARWLTQRLGRALTPAGPGLYSLETPVELCGAGVATRYPLVTFLRSVAVRHPARDVEFIHRRHPLAQAIYEHAWQQILGGGEQRPGQRFAVRRHPLVRKGGPVAVFAWLASDHPPAGQTFFCALHTDCTPADEAFCAVALDSTSPSGEVPWSDVETAFGPTWDRLRAQARETAGQRLERQQQQAREQRNREALILREDAERYRTDRLREIDHEEQLARTAEERGPGAAQILLFESRDVSGFPARRAAVDTFHRRRLEEIAAYETGQPTPALHPLGVLFIFPDQ